TTHAHTRPQCILIMTSTRASPTPTLATSQEIRDRGSTFVGYIYHARTADEARVALRHHTRPRHAGEHKDGKDVRELYVIAAWRCMVVKPGRTGLGGPDEFTVEEGCEDGGERWAGGRALGVMKREGAIDAVVVICRWFGGTLLGPVRFTHIETCAREVCRRFKKMEEMEECVQTLRTLDDLLATLRAELATARESGSTQDSSGITNSRATGRVPDYRSMQDGLDLTKAKRLIHARECAIEATKTLIEKYKTTT
ncbi:ribosomal protein S5 domain 2-like protein, partial [Boletus coccyginus]